MPSMINFAIDLGTTNSLITRFDKGQIEVFKNPSGFKETLPSVVGFRKDAILVGERARSYAERDAASVVGRFKRKMGTTETFRIKSLGISKSPVELSAEVLKELKTFVRSVETLDSVVITIPASFDTVQSNATKEAGIMAGFKTVVLLQEPIAASLAYANKEKNLDLRNSQWLVYDLGGGTFDVALVRIIEGELTVLDHEGDNYLGGTDFDALLVENIFVPALERQGKFEDLIGQMKSASGRYNALWYRLLSKAEEAKVELSARTATEVYVGQVKDDNGDICDAPIEVTRSEFEKLIKDLVDRTIEMMRIILTRNSLHARDLEFILMVGGSTFIPFVQRRVQEIMQIPLNTGIDPVNAIVVGAAYYAGTKEKPQIGQDESSHLNYPIKIKAAYARTSQETEETFIAKIEGVTEGLAYRIIAEDGSYDSGIKKLGSRIVEDLPLREGAFNVFSLNILDPQGNTVQVEFDFIQIAQGRYSVAGQMLPEDISLVKDRRAAEDTMLVLIFAKNTILPSKTPRPVTVEVANTIVKGSNDQILVKVVEGPSNHHSSTNKTLGILSITGTQISRDLVKGTEIDLTIEMSESRDLTIAAYLNGTGQQFSQIFGRQDRTVSSRLLIKETLALEDSLQEEIQEAKANGSRETIEALAKVMAAVGSLIGEMNELTEDDVTETKFQLEDKKRRLAQDMFELTASKRLDKAKALYLETRSQVSQLVRDSGNDRERHIVSEILAREQTFINSTDPGRIDAITKEFERVRWPILLRTPDFLVGMFRHLVDRRPSMNDQIQSKQLIENGKHAIEKEAWDELRQVIDRLWDLMPAAEQASKEAKFYTNIV